MLAAKRFASHESFLPSPPSDRCPLEVLIARKNLQGLHGASLERKLVIVGSSLQTYFGGAMFIFEGLFRFIFMLRLFINLILIFLEFLFNEELLGLFACAFFVFIFKFDFKPITDFLVTMAGNLD